MKLLGIPAFVIFGLLLTASSSFAAHDFGKLTGIVADPAGNPQMGASVWLTPEFAGGRAIELLTDENGIFVGQRLRPGLYSVKVTLAGFMPSVQDHISIGASVNASIHVELDSIFASLDQLRRKSPKPAEPDDWKWVLRTSTSSRPVLQLRDGTVVIANSSRDEKDDQLRMSVKLNNGSVRPGSSSALPGYLGTAVSYDQSLGSAGELLMARSIMTRRFPECSAARWQASGYPLANSEKDPKPLSLFVKYVSETRVDPSERCGLSTPNKWS